MDDRAATILEMLTDLHGTVASLSFDGCETDDRLDVVEADLAAIIPVAARTMETLDAMGRTLAEMGERLARLEAAGA